MNTMRSRFGAILVPMKHTLRKIMEYNTQPHVLVLVGDQTPPREESQYFINFLNQPTAIFLGVHRISGMHQCGFQAAARMLYMQSQCPVTL